MSTEPVTPAERAKQISDRLLEIGPYPERAEQVTARGLARYLAVRAAVINHQQLSPDAPFSRRQVDLLTVLFAAAHALHVFEGLQQVHADAAAREIWNAWEDGAGIGEWLWDHLGSAAASEIGPLADELAVLAKAAQPAEGLLAHADPIRHALNRAMVDAKSANHRDAYMRAVIALDSELEKAASDEKADELAKLRSACQTLGRIVTAQARTFEAARIEMLQNGPEAAMQWILNSIPDVDDNEPEDQWDGTETATQWIDRQQAADRAAEAKP